MIYYVLFLFCFETRSCYVAQAGLKSSCLSFPGTGIAEIGPLVWQCLGFISQAPDVARMYVSL